MRKRKTNSFRQGCHFEIYLVLSEDGKALEVSNVTLNHNHSPSKELYDYLPRQRRLAGDLRQHGKDVLRLKANSKMFQQEIESSTGHAITLKDIANLKYEDKKKNNSNDIEEVVNYLKTQDGADVDVIVDQELKGTLSACSIKTDICKIFTVIFQSSLWLMLRTSFWIYVCLFTLC